MAQLRFRAEHAHKMPDTTAGWYLYHKSKNYHAMKGGIQEGFRMGFKTGFWSLMALSLESTVDRYRGSSDMFSTVVATLTVAGAFSLWRELISFIPLFRRFLLFNFFCFSSFHFSWLFANFFIILALCPKKVKETRLAQVWLSPALSLCLSLSLCFPTPLLASVGSRWPESPKKGKKISRR